ncbi:MAG: anthranilate phosphoribosyltransferase [Phycisphaerales bacterium]
MPAGVAASEVSGSVSWYLTNAAGLRFALRFGRTIAYPARVSTPSIIEILKSLASGTPMDEDESYAMMSALLQGEMAEAQIGALLGLIAARGPTPDELVGAARVMRERVTPVPYTAGPGESLIDTCGTGGAPKTFNVSTAAAILAAAVTPPAQSRITRVVVAKHGNRSRTGRGSAEVLQALGVNLDATPERQAECLRQAGICFCFAINHHPAMRHAAGPRKALGFPTIFNMLGPLTNPAGATRQLIGVARREYVSPIATTLARLGTPHARVVHSRNGLDEITTTDTIDVAVVRGDSVTLEEIDPASLGLAAATIEQIRVEGVEESAALVRSIFAGEPGHAADTVALSTAAALMVAGVAETMQQGLTLSREALGSGAAMSKLQELAEVSNAGA